MATKTCSKCNVNKSIDNYYQLKTGKDGRRPDCKDCHKKGRKEREARPEIKEKRAKFYHDRHIREKDKRNAYHKEWYQANLADGGKGNPEYYQHYREMVNENQKKLGAKNPMFRVKRNLSRTMNKFFKKEQTTMDIIGCSPDFLREWIQYQLAPASGLTMANYGDKWHIDHVVPCALFDFSNNAQHAYCYNWSNLRPYPASDNIRKSDDLDLKLIETHQSTVRGYVTLKNMESKIGTDVLYKATSVQLQLPVLNFDALIKTIRGNDLGQGNNVGDKGTIRSEVPPLKDGGKRSETER